MAVPPPSDQKLAYELREDSIETLPTNAFMLLLESNNDFIYKALFSYFMVEKHVVIQDGTSAISFEDEIFETLPSLKNALANFSAFLIQAQLAGIIKMSHKDNIMSIEKSWLAARDAYNTLLKIRINDDGTVGVIDFNPDILFICARDDNVLRFQKMMNREIDATFMLLCAAIYDNCEDMYNFANVLGANNIKSFRKMAHIAARLGNLNVCNLIFEWTRDKYGPESDKILDLANTMLSEAACGYAASINDAEWLCLLNECNKISPEISPVIIDKIKVSIYKGQRKVCKYAIKNGANDFTGFIKNIIIYGHADNLYDLMPHNVRKKYAGNMVEYGVDVENPSAYLTGVKYNLSKLNIMLQRGAAKNKAKICERAIKLMINELLKPRPLLSSIEDILHLCKISNIFEYSSASPTDEIIELMCDVAGLVDMDYNSDNVSMIKELLDAHDGWKYYNIPKKWDRGLLNDLI